MKVQSISFILEKILKALSSPIPTASRGNYCSDFYHH